MEVLAASAISAVPTQRGVAQVRFTTRADGDFHADRVGPDELRRRQRAVVDLPWTFLDEVHGTDVVTVRVPGEHTGATADAAVTAVTGAVLGAWVGDCAPVALVGSSGVLGAAHAGWRGVLAGVLPATVRAMRALEAGDIVALVGPCIGAECYEFGAPELHEMAERFGPGVVATSTGGAPALDMVAAVAASLAEVGVAVASTGPCTACDERYWSHRARGDLGRQAMAIWLEPQS